MQRYFVGEKLDDKFILSKDDSYHIIKVMRMCLGSRIEIVFNNITYIAEIVSLNPLVSAKVIDIKEKCNELKHSVFLVQSLVKEQKMDLILQKNTELGIAGIYPYQAQRSLVKLNGKETKKIDRWQKIVKEAAEQSKRNKIPRVFECLNLDELCKLEGFDYKFIATVNEQQKKLKKVLSNLEECATMVIVVGPEGGFSPEEEKKLIEYGYIPISLGESVLRTETASIFFTSAVRYLDME